jgi:hypothetical protein
MMLSSRTDTDAAHTASIRGTRLPSRSTQARRRMNETDDRGAITAASEVLLRINSACRIATHPQLAFF